MESMLLASPFEFVMGIRGFVEQVEAFQVAILVAGLFLLIIEMFIPGFGVAGITGVVLLIVGIILTARTPFEAFVMFLILVFLLAILLRTILRSAAKGKLSKKLILNLQAKQELGYTASKDSSEMIGRKGIALTDLRPAGTGEFDKVRLDIVTEGGFIEKGTKIKIISVNGNRIVVESMVEQSLKQNSCETDG